MLVGLGDAYELDGVGRDGIGRGEEVDWTRVAIVAGLTMS